MAPDSLTAGAVLAATAVLAAVALALLWDRVRGWPSFVVRPLLIALCVLTGTATAVVVADHQLGFFDSWRELAGLGPGQPPPEAATTVTVADSGSRIVEFTVVGRASGLTLRAYAYLPPGYDAPPLSHQRLPVIEALDGYPGAPHVWLSTLRAPRILDEEIASGRMAPTVVVFPYQTVTAARDTECVDAVGGVAMDTFLTRDVPDAVIHRLRVRTDGAGWGLIGYSTGGYCAVNLALRHPARYAAAASLSGNFDAETSVATGDLYRGNTAVREQNDPLWRVSHTTPPAVSLYLAAGLDDADSVRDIQRFMVAARPPLRVTTAALPRTGHSEAAWRAMQPPAYDWLSSWLAGPLQESALSR